MNPVFRFLAVALLGSLLGGLYLVLMQDVSAQPGPDRPYRLFAVNVARDGVQLPPSQGGALPAPDPSYCPGSSGGQAPPSPPNSILGLLTINGFPAPAGTVVQVFFDGKAGPAVRTREAGGYRVDYAGGGAQCANKVGSAIAISVNGQLFDSAVRVGDPAANPFLRFDIAVP